MLNRTMLVGSAVCKRCGDLITLRRELSGNPSDAQRENLKREIQEIPMVVAHLAQGHDVSVTVP